MDRPRRSRTELEAWFETLMTAHGPALGRLVATYARPTGEREDLVQDIALAIWTALPGFVANARSARSSFESRTTALTHVARRRLPIADPDADLELEDTAPDPERTFSSEQRTQRLADAIRQLPLGQAQVVTLTLEGLSDAEIADVLGISETNVGARLTRARAMLRQMLRT